MSVINIFVRFSFKFFNDYLEFKKNVQAAHIHVYLIRYNMIQNTIICYLFG